MQYVCCSHACRLFLCYFGWLSMISVSTALFSILLCCVAVTIMADPDEIDMSYLMDDAHAQCLYHQMENHRARNISGCYKEWNDRVLKFIPCKDCGRMRYTVKVETAPNPTRRSPKPSTCVKVKSNLCLYFFFIWVSLVLKKRRKKWNCFFFGFSQKQKETNLKSKKK